VVKGFKLVRADFGLALSVVLIIFGSANPAYAYIDPGSGTFLVQLIISALLGAVFFARQMILRLARAFWHTSATPSKGNEQSPD
jgi:hypothetical protein